MTVGQIPTKELQQMSDLKGPQRQWNCR